MARVTARAAVMQMIFETLEGGEGGEETLQMVYDELRNDGLPGVESIDKDEPGEKDREYITKVLQGVLDHKDDLDDAISRAAHGWIIDRMNMVDLTVLRLATWEIMYEDDVPGSVAIAEALDLIERYSDPDDKSFVNGVLGTILREHEAKQ